MYILLVIDSNPDSLKTKKSELRLYCDLLMQQVHMIKTAASNESELDLQVSFFPETVGPTINK